MNEAQKEAIANAEAHLNNAGLKLAIYTVTVLPVHDGRRRMELHHVAGFSSEDAERRIKDHSMRYLNGDCYISTDEGVADMHDACCRHYITRWNNGDSINDEEYARWVQATCEPETNDGQTTGPRVRRFEPFLAVYVAGVGWRYEDGHGRHGSFDTEADAIAAARKHALGRFEHAF